LIGLTEFARLPVLCCISSEGRVLSEHGFPLKKKNPPDRHYYVIRGTEMAALAGYSLFRAMQPIPEIVGSYVVPLAFFT
jgi:hypothetical protein